MEIEKTLADLRVRVGSTGRWLLQSATENAPGPFPKLMEGDVLVAEVLPDFRSGWQFRCCSMEDAERVFEQYKLWKRDQHPAAAKHAQLRWHAVSLEGAVWTGQLPPLVRLDFEKAAEHRAPSEIARWVSGLLLLPAMLLRVLRRRKEDPR